LDAVSNAFDDILDKVLRRGEVLLVVMVGSVNNEDQLTFSFTTFTCVQTTGGEFKCYELFKYFKFTNFNEW